VGGCVPRWWHHHGGKLRIVTAYESRIVLLASAAEVNIAKATDRVDAERWSVDWHIVHNYHSGEDDRGRRLFTRDKLALAFGITKANGCESLQDHAADREVYGFFIGLGCFLNIPGPGTGHDGDPNVSILIDDELRQAVRKLLGL